MKKYEVRIKVDKTYVVEAKDESGVCDAAWSELMDEGEFDWAIIEVPPLKC